MHDFRVLRDQVDALREGMRRRGRLDNVEALIERGLILDRERRAMIVTVEERKAARNSGSMEVARRRKAGESAEELIAAGRVLGDEISRIEEALAASEGALRDILLELPNIPLPDVPAGDETQNRIVSSWGTPRDSAGCRPHWELATALGILDLERAARISGSGFVVLRGLGARLARSLMNFFIDVHVTEHGYEEVWVPSLVKRSTMTGTGQLPKFEDDLYAVKGEDLFLIPTAEVPVTNLYRDEILDAATLPRGFVAYTPCFRREAGAAGKDTRGMLRVHQFDKVEIVRYCAPEDTDEQHELLTRHAESLLERLGLPYRRVLLSAGDTGQSSARTWDLEVFAPGVGAWLEVSSCSTFTDYQARRANIRYRPAPGEKPRFIHTLNGSGLAFPRVIAALIEHYQQPDGSVVVPEVLQPLLGTSVLS
ncbi:MAG: serine--tRNA ligase [Gemmatimonadota bacterium]